MILRCSERSDDRNRFLASCCVSVEPPCTVSPALRFCDQRAQRAEQVDAEMLEEAAILGRQRGLDQMIGDFVERHGVVAD